jgi:hypothetical protein
MFSVVQYSECPEVQQLLKIADGQLAEQKCLAELKGMMMKPLVVVEGMDATGSFFFLKFEIMRCREKHHLYGQHFTNVDICITHTQPYWVALGAERRVHVTWITLETVNHNNRSCSATFHRISKRQVQ